MLVSYRWLQEEYFDDKLPSAEEVAEALMLHSFEIEGVEEKNGDAIIDVDVLPNRAHDCLSHRGIAKEISVILGIPFSEKTIEANFSNIDTSLKVSVEEPKLCKRYIGRVIKNIEVRESPDWLRKYLESVGQRSINALVDATNYVLLDMGQPTHVFDVDKLASPEICIKKSSSERIKTLSGEEVELAEDDLIIADSEGPLAIAGVKGGTKAEVTKDTTNIVLESAHFDPVSVRKTSRRLGILTDSSKRFENEPPIDLAPEAIEYLTRLVVQLCGTDETVVEYAVDSSPQEAEERKVVVDSTYINKLLGVQLADQEIADVFNKLGWDYIKTGNEFSVTIPADRLDVTHPADLVEEVGRVYGYAHIPSTPLPETSPRLLNKEFYYVTKIKQALVQAGFSEVYTQSFVPVGELKMANPVAQDKPYLRTSIDLSDVFEMNVRNKDVLGIDDVKIFEIGNVFAKDATEKLVLVLKTEKAPLTENPLEEFGIDITSGDIEVELGSVIEHLPEVVSYDELHLDSEDTQQFEHFSQYPVIVRDIAVWVPQDVEREELVSLIKHNAGELLLNEPRLVDTYTKDDRVSYAHRLVFQSKEKTLTDEEIGEIMERVESAITEEGWEVR